MLPLIWCRMLIALNKCAVNQGVIRVGKNLISNIVYFVFCKHSCFLVFGVTLHRAFPSPGCLLSFPLLCNDTPKGHFPFLPLSCLFAAAIKSLACCTYCAHAERILNSKGEMIWLIITPIYLLLPKHISSYRKTRKTQPVWKPMVKLCSNYKQSNILNQATGFRVLTLF